MKKFWCDCRIRLFARLKAFRMIHWLEPALKGSAYTQYRTVCERRSLTLYRWQNWRTVEIDMPIGFLLLHAEFEMQRDVLIDLKM